MAEEARDLVQRLHEEEINRIRQEAGFPRRKRQPLPRLIYPKRFQVTPLPKSGTYSGGRLAG